MAVGAGVLVFTGLIEHRVDLAPKGRKAQEARAAERKVGLDRRGIDTLGGEDFEGARFQCRVGGQSLDPPSQSRLDANQTMLRDGRQGESADLGVGIDEQSLEILHRIGPAPESGLGRCQCQSAPAQCRLIVGQG